MKPTQEQILSALNKLIKESKTELKTEKVELALVDDLKDMIIDAKRIISLQKDGFDWGERAEKQFKEVKKLVSNAEGISRGAIRQASVLKKDSDKILNKTEVQAKELGVSLKDIKGFSEANKLINEMSGNQKELNVVNKMLKKIL